MANALPLLIVGGAALYLLSKKGNGNGSASGQAKKVMWTGRFVDAQADEPTVDLRPGQSVVVTDFPIEYGFGVDDRIDDFVSISVNLSTKKLTIKRNQTPVQGGSSSAFDQIFYQETPDSDGRTLLWIRAFD